MKTALKKITEKKENGRIYTPGYIVKAILDMSGYSGRTILKKHVIDNSCGDGAFLREIVRRYCAEAKAADMSPSEIRMDLTTYIHGIEIERSERDKCIDNVNSAASEFHIVDIAWDILCEDALTIHKYDKKMDFVLGNPPYVRVHHLGNLLEDIKKFAFAQDGMTDLFIIFYEIGIRMLSPNGVLGYITPSSFYNSVAGTVMRKILLENQLLKKIVDLKHYQAFDATTYTTIVILQNGRKENTVEYYHFNPVKKCPEYVDTISSQDYWIGGKFYFAAKEDLGRLKKIFNNRAKCGIMVKNGYATLCDSVFVGDFEFESPFVIPVIKASKGIVKKIIFPYDKNSKLISEDEIKKDAALYSYLLSRKDMLTKRSNEKDAEKFWYAFGRSQAINDTFKDKLTMNALMRDENDLKFADAPAGVGVYGGLYLVSDSIPPEKMKAVLKTQEFSAYVALLSKYKSGGYYTFSSKDVKAYLDYKFSYDGG